MAILQKYTTRLPRSHPSYDFTILFRRFYTFSLHYRRIIVNTVPGASCISRTRALVTVGNDINEADNSVFHRARICNIRRREIRSRRVPRRGRRPRKHYYLKRKKQEERERERGRKEEKEKRATTTLNIGGKSH